MRDHLSVKYPGFFECFLVILIILFSANEIDDNSWNVVLSVFEDLEKLGATVCKFGSEFVKSKDAVAVFVVAPQIQR